MWNSIGDWTGRHTLEAENSLSPMIIHVMCWSIHKWKQTSRRYLCMALFVRRLIRQKQVCCCLNTNTRARVIDDCGNFVVLSGALANTNTNRCLKSWIIHGAMLRWRHQSTCDSFRSVTAYASHSFRFRSTLIICCSDQVCVGAGGD